MSTLNPRHFAKQIDNLTEDYRDYTQYVSDLAITYEHRNARKLTTINGTEYAFKTDRKAVVKVTFRPMRGETLAPLLGSLQSGSISIEVLSPLDSLTEYTRLTVNTDDKYDTRWLHDYDGSRYFAGLTLTFSQR